MDKLFSQQSKDYLKMDKQKIKQFLETYTDIFSDAYLTKQRIRYAIKENVELLFKCIEKGDKLFINENGLAIVVGYSDDAPRKYIKMLARNNEVAETLLKEINESIKEDLFVKIKKNNPLKQVFEKNGYVFKGGRGREILLVRKQSKEK